MSEVDSYEVKEDSEIHTTYPKVPSADASPKTFARYMSSRISTLFACPGFQKDSKRNSTNPRQAIAAMNRSQWNKFAHGFLAWTIDAFDFFCVSVFATEISVSLNVEVTDITWGITLVLMLRSVGSVIFGFLGDKYGRKWPLCLCYTCFIVLEIGTGFVKTLREFLACRALFGIAMGGCYALAAGTALEDAPQVSRGFLSGIFLPGYSFGYVLATVFYRAFDVTSKTWRALFWFSALPPLLLLLWRLTFGEIEYFLQLQEAKKLHNQRIREAIKAKSEGVETDVPDSELNELTFWHELKEAFRTEWPLMIYLIIMMSAWNFISHGSQDLYPTMLKKQALMNANQVTVTNVIVNLGGMCGGLFWGQMSEFLGRRLAVACCCIFGGALSYPAFMIHKMPVTIVCGFFLQFSVFGAWGICPIHLTELTSKTALRTMISGTAYQLGNLASSASSTIEAKIGSRFPLPELGTSAYDYGKVMCIFMGCVFSFLLLCMIFGPERYHAEIKTDFMLYEEEDDNYAVDKVLSHVPKNVEKTTASYREDLRD